MPAICFESPIPDLCKIQGLPMEPAANMTPLLHCAEKISDFFLKITPLHLLFKKPNDVYRPDKKLIDVFNKLLILHADHEQNCSTSTVRIVGSSHAGLFPSISAGISALAAYSDIPLPPRPARRSPCGTTQSWQGRPGR